MPKLANDRQERACQYRARGMTQADAYEKAGYARNNGNASELFRRPEILERVEEIKNELHDLEERRRAAAADLNAETETEDGINKEWIINRYKEIVEDFQLNKKSPAAAVSALKELAKLKGYDDPPQDPKNPPPGARTTQQRQQPAGAKPPPRSLLDEFDNLTENAQLNDELQRDAEAADGAS